MSDSSIKTIFNRIAPVYDHLNDWLSFGLHRLWKQMTVKWSNANSGDICLDLCCGSGDLAILMAQAAGPTGAVYGVDFSPPLLERARQRALPWLDPIAPIYWVEADALNLPFDDNYFDACTIGYGLRNITDIPRCLAELYRVLKPGAKAAILDFHRPSNPVMRDFQQWYLDNLVVPIASYCGFRDEYAYISPSLEKFPNASLQVKLARDVGFAATHYTIAGGMMGVLVVTK